MVRCCCIVNCHNKHGDTDEKGNKLRFYVIPQSNKPFEKNRRELWLRAIHRDNWTPEKYKHAFVCSAHFAVTGKRSDDPSHPDFVPNKGVHLVEHGGSKPASEGSVKRYERFKKRQKVNNESYIESNRQPAALVTSPEQSCTSEDQAAAEVLLSLKSQSCIQETVSNKKYEDLKLMYDRLQTDHLIIKEELTKLKKENGELKEKLQNAKFGYHKLKTCDKKLQFYTGLPSNGVFAWIISICRVSLCRLYYLLSWEDHFLILFMKLKLGLFNQDIANRFEIKPGVVSQILRNWLPIISATLKPLIKWPSKLAVRQYLPVVFKGRFRNVRCIIDCTKIFIQRPNNLTTRAQTWSNYKHHNTIKYLIGITPAGAVSFVSIGWGGRASDKKITCDTFESTGFMDLIEYGDVIMADRGFQIRDELAIRGAHLKIPSFTKGKKQLSAMEVHTSRQLARARIHIERVIGQLKTFRILQTVVPITQVDLLDDIMIVCSSIINLSKSIVPLD